MALGDMGEGLSNLGFNVQSDSSGLASKGPTLDDLLGNSILDEVGKSRLLEAEIAKRKASEPGIGSRIKDPSVAIPVLAAIAAAIFGKGDEKLAGLGAAAGAIGNEAALQEVQRSQKDKALKQLNDELEKSQDRLDKTRNRMATLFNTNPEAFISPSGEGPDARVLGWYMTGVDIPLFPQTRLMNDRRDDLWEKRFDVLNKGLEGAQSRDQARGIMQAMARHLNWAVAPETLDSLASALGTPDFESEFASTLLRHGGPTALDAMIFAGQNGLTLHDPRVLRMVKFQNDDAGREPSQVLNQKFIDLMAEVNEWQSDPANTNRVLRIQEQAEGNVDKATAGIIEAALQGRNADIAFLRDRTNLPGNRSLAEMIQAMSILASKEQVLDTLTGLQELPALKALTPEERRQRRAQMALQLIDQTEETAGQRQGTRDAVLSNQLAAEIQGQLSIGIDQVYPLVNGAFDAAIEDFSKLQANEQTRERFDAMVRSYVSDIIKQYKEIE